jgi:hypothetical protein
VVPDAGTAALEVRYEKFFLRSVRNMITSVKTALPLESCQPDLSKRAT